MIIEGELKDYIIIPIEDLVGLINEYKTSQSIKNERDVFMFAEAKIQLLEDILEKYSK